MAGDQVKQPRLAHEDTILVDTVPQTIKSIEATRLAILRVDLTLANRQQDRDCADHRWETYQHLTKPLFDVRRSDERVQQMQFGTAPLGVCHDLLEVDVIAIARNAVPEL